MPGQRGGAALGQARARGVTRWKNQQVLIRKMIKEVWQTVFLWVFLMKSLRGEESTWLLEELK